MSKQPNIVFILADDMGYGDLASYGAEKIPTPYTDRLAAEGMRFTDAHSSSAVCTPSRYSVMTGRYCWRSRLTAGVLGGFGAPLIGPERLTVASMLKEQGYATGAVGKWHLGLNWTTNAGGALADTDSDSEGWNLDGFNVDYSKPVTGGPTDLGFDHSFCIAGSLDMPPYCYIENDRVVGTPDREKETYFNQQRRGMQTPDWQDDEVDTTFARQAVEFIEHHQRTRPDQPFFLYLPTASPHRPCDVRPDFVKGRSQAGDRGDMVVLHDWVVGQVLDVLDRKGLTDSTLVIATSDNGGRAVCADGLDHGHRTNGDWRGQKADIWDGGHREPFIVRWPERIAAGSVCDQTVCLSDFMATCADITEFNLPTTAAEDSVSILPLLDDAQSQCPVREHIVHHSVNGMFSLRRGQWKLVCGLGSGGFSEPRTVEPVPDGPQGQLYDMVNDPGESRNLWQDRPELVRELSDVLENCRQEERSAPRDR